MTKLFGGKVLFTEIMVAKADFEVGKSWTEVLRPLPGHAIDHVDIELVPHAEHLKITCGG